MKKTLQIGNPDYCDGYNKAWEEAEAEIDHLRASLDACADEGDSQLRELDRLRAEIAIWKDRATRGREIIAEHYPAMEDAASQIDRLRADNSRLETDAIAAAQRNLDIRVEIDRLHAELAAASKLLEQEKKDYDDLMDENDSLRAENAGLLKDLVKSSEDMGRICEENAALRQQLMNSRSSTMNDGLGAGHDSSNNTNSPPSALTLRDHLTD